MKTWWKIGGIAALALLLAPLGSAQQTQSQDAQSKGSQGKTSAAAAKKKKEELPEVHIKPGTNYPHFEGFLGYSFVGFHVQGPGIYKLNGGSASLAYNLNNWFGLAADFGGYKTDDCIDGPYCYPPTTLKSQYHTILDTYMFGPRFSYRRGRLTPYAQALFGEAHGTDFYGFSGTSSSSLAITAVSTNAFAWAAGGGVDIRLNRHFSWRAIQTEYLMTRFSNYNATHHENAVRVSTGLVFTWDRHPVEINRPPTVSLSADKTSIQDGSGDSIMLHAIGSDPDGDTLAYTWTATNGQVQGTGTDARWTQGNMGPGGSTVTVHVDDGYGGTANASVDLKVTPKPPPPPPTMSCSVDRSSVQAGERVTVTATANSPANFPLNYTWRANAGQVVGTGQSVQFDTTGLGPGSYTITGRIEDGHGGAADCQTSVQVQQPPPPPQASKINECSFKALNGARVDNVCKRVLDDVAVRLQNEPKGTVVIIGYADPKERHSDRLATDRGTNAKKYLTAKGIDQSRITVRQGSGQAGAGAANRRLEIIWVPEGATY
jgi:opacity protein-like surface antigen/outer membrane protein OmpA-like peptidoglycan-associated protein